MSQLSKRSLYAVATVLVLIIVLQAGWLISYRGRVDDLEKQYTAAIAKINSLTPKSDESTLTALAYRHISAICAKDLSGIMSQYAPDAKLYWLGGTLNGNFTDKNGIQDEWSKFFKSNSGCCVNCTNFNTKTLSGFHAGWTGGVVTARLNILTLRPDGTLGQIPVNYALVYMLRDGNWVLVDEWWAVAPNWTPYMP